MVFVFLIRCGNLGNEHVNISDLNHILMSCNSYGGKILLSNHEHAYNRILVHSHQNRPWSLCFCSICYRSCQCSQRYQAFCGNLASYEHIHISLDDDSCYRHWKGTKQSWSGKCRNQSLATFYEGGRFRVLLQSERRRIDDRTRILQIRG